MDIRATGGVGVGMDVGTGAGVDAGGHSPLCKEQRNLPLLEPADKYLQPKKCD